MNHPTAFDPMQFLDAQQTEVNERRPPLPTENPDSSDGLYLALIRGVKQDSGTMEKGERAGQPWVSVVLPLEIQVPQSIQDSTKMQPTVILTDRVFLSLTPQGSIDNSPGKNRGQKTYREALDLNKPGDIWSWRKAEGQAVKVRISHELYEGEIQERVSGVFRR